MECGGARSELQEELAEDEFGGEDASGWDRAAPDELSPFMVLQYPLLQLGHGRELSRREAVANLLVNMLGVGLLAMPRALATAGLLTGAMVLAGIAAASRIALLLLLRLAGDVLHSGPPYPEIGKAAMGPQGVVAVMIAHLLYSGGLLTAYLVALTDLAQQALGELQGTPDVARFPAVVVAIGLCAPGAVLRNVRFVAAVSGACMVGAAVLVLSLLAACLGDFLPAWLPGAPEDAAGVSEDVVFVQTGPGGLLAAASLFTAQLSVHAGFIEVLGGASGSRHVEVEMNFSGRGRRASGLDVEAVSRDAFLAAALLLGSLGAAGYMRFGGSVAGDVLSSFGTGYVAVSGARRTALLLARVAYGLTLAVASAYVSAPCRAMVLELFAVRRSMGGTSNRAFRRASALVLGVCGLAAWLQQDLALVLSFVGAWAAGPLGFMLPSIFAVELARRQDRRSITSLANLRYFGLFALGALLLLGHLCDSVAAALSQPLGHRGQRVTVHDLSNITSRVP